MIKQRSVNQITGIKSSSVRVNRHRADWRGWKFMWPFALVFTFVFIIPILYAIY
ncbi:sugar ABC transporter permease, partial [Bifidobacterium pseudocatenulatum]|nr:sugar ABC transporter permease [Bifidobacterium pseudocatenulatum]